jgi:hypothetical protein
MTTKPLRYLVVLSLAASHLSAAELIFENGFETGDLTGFTASGNVPAVVTSPVASGKYAGNFNLTRSMATSYRTEVVVGEKGKFAWDSEYWVGFAFRFEQWAADHDMEIAPFQIHPTPNDWATARPAAQISHGPVMMAVRLDEIRVYTYGGKIAWQSPVVTGKWIRIALRFIPSFRNDGMIEMWKDGEKIVSVSGRNAVELDDNGKPMRPPYWKMGIYKWNWKQGRPATDSTRRQLLIDDLRIAKGPAGYAIVSPDTPQRAETIKAAKP